MFPPSIETPGLASKAANQLASGHGPTPPLPQGCKCYVKGCNLDLTPSERESVTYMPTVAPKRGYSLKYTCKHTNGTCKPEPHGLNAEQMELTLQPLSHGSKQAWRKLIVEYHAERLVQRDAADKEKTAKELAARKKNFFIPAAARK